MTLFRYIPVAVGGCRPIDVADKLRSASWSVEIKEEVIQAGFRSEVLVARSPNESVAITESR
jgi:hypothetical protein